MPRKRRKKERPLESDGDFPSGAGRIITARDVDGSEARPGTLTADPPERIAELEASNRELRRELDDLKRAAASVRQSVDLFRSLVENTPNTVMTVGRDGVIQFVNRNNFPGYVGEDLVGTSLYDLVGSAHSDRYRKEIEAVFATGESRKIENEVRDPGGEVRWYQTLCGPLKRDGKVVAASLITFDHTEIKRVGDALRGQEDTYKKLTEVLTDVVLKVSPTARLEYVSPAVKEFGGYEPDDMVGKHIADFFSRKSELLSTLGVIKTILMDKKGGKAEFLFKAKGRDPFYVEATGEPLVEDGKVVTIQCVMRDISERKAEEEALQRRARDLAALNELAMKLARVDSVESVYEEAADALKLIFNAKAVAITAYDDAAEELRVAHVSAPTALIAKANKYAGGLFEAVRTPVDDAVKEAMLSGSCVSVFDGFYELTNRRMPKRIGGELAKALGVREIRTASLRYGDALLGGVAVFTGENGNAVSAGIFESFANVIAAAVRRQLTGEELRHRAAHLRFINELAIDLGEAASVDEVFQIVGDRLRMLTGARLVIAASLEAGKNDLTVRHLSGGEGIISKVAESGFAVGAGFSQSEDRRRAMLTDRVTAYAGLHELSDGKVPKLAAAALEKALGSGRIQAVSLRSGDEVVGGVAILLPEGEGLFSKGVLENFANVAASAIKRKQADEALVRARDELEDRVRGRTIELTEALKRLAESEETYRKLVGTLPDGVTVLNLDGIITYASPQAAALHGYDDAEDLIGKPFTMFIPPEIREGAAADFKNSLRAEGVSDLEIDILRLDGSSFVGEIRSTPLRDAAGAPSSAIVTIRDVTERKRAEDALRRAVGENEALLEAIPDLMFVINKEGTYVDFKQSSEESLAIPPEAIIGKNVRDTGFTPATEREVSGQIERTLLTGEAGLVEYELETPVGPGIYEARFVKLAEDEVLSVVRDVTERKHAEIALKESEERFRSVVEQSPFATAIYAPDGALILANEAFGKLWGLDTAGLEAMRDEFNLLTDDKIRASGIGPYIERGFGGEVTVIPPHSYDFEVPGGDEPEVISLWLRGSLYPVKAVTGEVQEVVVMLEDVTESKQAERALRESEELYRNLIEMSPDPIGFSDMEGEILAFNKRGAEVMGYADAEELVGRNLFDLVAPRQLEEAAVVLQELVDKRTAVNASFDFRRSDGSYMPTESSGSIVSDAEGNPKGFIFIMRDITERQRADEELRRARDELEHRVTERTAELNQSNEELRAFTYIVSHDLRAPLVNLQGFAAELREAVAAVTEKTSPALPHLDDADREAVETVLCEDVPEALGYIEASVGRMDRFIQGVLKLSRLGRRELEPESLDIKEIVEGIMASLRHQLDERSASFGVGDVPDVYADRIAVEQIMGNLLTNAVLYLEPSRPGEINVTGSRAGNRVTFHVRDNGRGIKPEDIKKIFEPFSRVGKRVVPGEGMGLTYVQTLVRRHGGRIWCESEPGVGTTFSFTIPVDQTEGDTNAE
ncbi:MAG: PAS domain S-box protein [Candidatus Zixiibacteriota bacterium]|jgi:PAS domain S-box-containing protein